MPHPDLTRAHQRWISRAAATTLTAASLVLLCPSNARAGQGCATRSEATFTQALDRYMSVRTDATRAVPPLISGSDARTVLENVSVRATAIRRARPAARIGDVIPVETARALAALIRRLVRERGDTLDDFAVGLYEGDVVPDGPVPNVNDAFPWSLAGTMPAEVLEALPKLPSALQYRFVGRDLVLVDIDANLVVDKVSGILNVGTGCCECNE